MSKRFIDSGLFDDPWFMDLSNRAKLFWILLITKCNHAGIIKANDKLFKFYLSVNSLDTVYKELSNRLIEINDHYIFIPKYIQFQYPKGLQDNVKAQLSAKMILREYSLWDEEKQTVREQLGNSYRTVKNKSKNKNTDKNKNKEVNSESDFEEFWKQVPNKLGKGKARDAFVNALKKSGVTLEIIMAGLPGYIKYEKGRSRQEEYRPLHPSTWLNQERWSDVIPGAKKKKGFDILIRFSDGREPETYHMASKKELSETIEKMKLSEINAFEYYLDVEAAQERFTGSDHRLEG